MNFVIWAVKSLAVGLAAVIGVITVVTSIVWVPMVFVYLFGELMGPIILIALVVGALGSSLLMDM